jgi:hypothetical protein
MTDEDASQYSASAILTLQATNQSIYVHLIIYIKSITEVMLIQDHQDLLETYINT